MYIKLGTESLVKKVGDALVYNLLYVEFGSKFYVISEEMRDFYQVILNFQLRVRKIIIIIKKMVHF